ncbi:UNVERIFIED_CONTAM: hypothetical protein FKN15_002253 [Acipenser sinensis]
MKLGPGARNQCENAVTALHSSPLHGCKCKRGMKREKSCLSIYWSLHQSFLHGMNLVENSPYELVDKGFDYVRLASIASGSEVGMTMVNRCLNAAKACNVDEMCQKLRTEYVSACIKLTVKPGPCNRAKCNKALRKFFDRVPPEYTHELLFCPCTDTACAERRRQTIVPACSFDSKEKPNCLTILQSCKTDYVCRSRWAQYQYNCQPSPQSASGCKLENYGACLLSYTGMIGCSSSVAPSQGSSRVTCSFPRMQQLSRSFPRIQQSNLLLPKDAAAQSLLPKDPASSVSPCQGSSSSVAPSQGSSSISRSFPSIQQLSRSFPRIQQLKSLLPKHAAAQSLLSKDPAAQSLLPKDPAV